MKLTKVRKEGGGKDFKTPQEKDVQAALNVFWYVHYTKTYTTDERNRLAEQFAKQWLDPTKVKIDKAFIRHPATAKRDFSRDYTVAEVLADFIMRVDQVAERSEEYPVNNPDHAVNGARERQENERSIYFQYEDDIAEQKGEEPRLPPYSVRENSIVAENSIEDVLFAEHSPDIIKFRAELRHVKQFAEFYATTFAEEYGFKKAETMRKIKSLDLSRVRECEICGSAFYAHDLRRHVCDMQYGIKAHRVKGKTPVYEVTDESTCELERERIKARERAKRVI
ncbi:hypothetical protein PZE06_18840 [Robertmurraya sp. DFI.2.37]|uniref:hypothetical protein n=1 Tax=Robertmurraya sp. DFI.2.37 TaxID=3031819 RepID=UPI0023DB9271|nr:hypothetical protein [Robertmurraya sp. DFI.2.37]MDF1510195.1 hypothetical protein [Robertmurraya sp. DFI.2.37]